MIYISYTQTFFACVSYNKLPYSSKDQAEKEMAPEEEYCRAQYKMEINFSTKNVSSSLKRSLIVSLISHQTLINVVPVSFAICERPRLRMLRVSQKTYCMSGTNKGNGLFCDPKHLCRVFNHHNMPNNIFNINYHKLSWSVVHDLGAKTRMTKINILGSIFMIQFTEWLNA